MVKETKKKGGKSESKSKSKPKVPPTTRSSSRHQKNSASRNPLKPSKQVSKDIEKWQNIRCVVCLDHPHNAVLLVCSLYRKGCRPFICDTSRRHSNCLTQLKKASGVPTEPQPDNKHPHPTAQLRCPLCRGSVVGDKVLDQARAYMDAKARSCSLESCKFSGNYNRLKKHAMKVHPFAWPSEPDANRQRKWKKMEERMDDRDNRTAALWLGQLP